MVIKKKNYLVRVRFFKKLIFSLIALFSQGDRVDELTPFANNTFGGGKGDLYLDFLINNVKPYVDDKFRTKKQREFTGIMGSSLGGLFSFYAGLKYQDIFSKIGVFSPSFWFSKF
jgi:predicted alpha/beta superfamily hydrolase